MLTRIGSPSGIIQIPPCLMVCVVASAVQIMPHPLSHLVVCTELTFSKCEETQKLLQKLWLNFLSIENFDCAKNISQAQGHMPIVSASQIQG